MLTALVSSMHNMRAPQGRKHRVSDHLEVVRSVLTPLLSSARWALL